MSIRPRRSVLYMPGSNARAIEKARTLAADAIILDLEDSVAPDAKAAARAQVTDAVKAGGFGTREVVIRINALQTPWGADDLAAAAASGPDAILVPKVSTAEDVFAVGERLAAAGAPASVAIWAMIETPRAALDPLAVAAAKAEPAGARLAAFVLGTNDLAKDTRVRLVPGRAPMLHWLADAVAAGHAFGLDVLDGVYNALDDAEGFAAECRQGADIGMDGKTLIHPNQIEAANRAFSPDPAEVAFARTLVDAFALPENAGKGALSLGGRMVERLHAEMAARTVALAEAISARSA
jgi:citrate lyase subunit beta/citryl-CoA lyase